MGVMAFLKQSYFSFKALYGYLDPKVYILFKVITPLFQLTFFSLLAKYSYNTTDITPWVLGNAIILSMYNSLFGVGAIFNSERAFGTLKTIIVSPTNNMLIFISRTFFHIIDSVFTIGIGIIFGWLIFDLDFSKTHIFTLILCIIICTFSSIGLGLLFSSLGLILTDLNMLLNILIFVLMFFTGALFPIEYLPKFLQYISDVIPITNGLKAARMVVNGSGIEQVYFLIIREFITGLTYVIVSYLIFSVLEKLASKKGTIDLY